MSETLQSRVRAALERSHRLGMIGGDLEEQLAHCASFVRVVDTVVAVDQPGRAADLGTGGGVPGVYLATALARWSWRLIEMRTGRAAELQRQVVRLGLDCVVDTRPAQQVGLDPDLRESHDLVTARSFGPPALVAECASGLVRVGGWVVVSEPPGADATDRWPEGCLAAWGFAPPERRAHDESSFVVFHKTTPAPDDIPRLPPRADRGWPDA